MKRVHIAHDFMETYGGAERVTQEIAQAFPKAEVTAILGRESVAERMGVADRFTSVMRPREPLLKYYRGLAPVWADIVRRHPLPEADVLVVSSYAFAHHFRTVNDAPKVSYTHSPLRFAWTMTDGYREERAGRIAPLGLAFSAFAARMRKVDRAGADTVDRFMTQSPFVAEQIEEFYGRPAEVIGAPVDCRLFHPSGRPPDDYWLLCGRLIEPYKQFGLALQAFAQLPDQRVVVAGDGPAYAELKAMAPPNVTFLGHLDDAELVPVMQDCRATLFPSRDDFGLIPVEVHACGRPVLAYGDGGALYTVRAGVTGEHFGRQTVACLVEALRAFDPEAYDPAAVRAHAMQWDSREFRQRLVNAVAATARGLQEV
jgi:glycosyltransferase involved in cell wall biosynthesis